MRLKLRQFKLKICRVDLQLLQKSSGVGVREGLLMEWGPSAQFLRFLCYTVSQIYSTLGA